MMSCPWRRTVLTRSRRYSCTVFCVVFRKLDRTNLDFRTFKLALIEITFFLVCLKHTSLTFYFSSIKLVKAKYPRWIISIDSYRERIFPWHCFSVRPRKYSCRLGVLESRPRLGGLWFYEQHSLRHARFRSFSERIYLRHAPYCICLLDLTGHCVFNENHDCFLVSSQE